MRHEQRTTRVHHRRVPVPHLRRVSGEVHAHPRGERKGSSSGYDDDDAQWPRTRTRRGAHGLGAAFRTDSIGMSARASAGAVVAQ